MDMTPNLNLPIPNADAVPATKISEEFPRLADALIMLDAIIFALQGVVAGKAAADHTQAISTITGLTEALASKMSATATFSLDSLTDVQGAADALVNYVLVKKASGQWEPSTALAALGIHNHSISEVVGLSEQLVAILDALDLLSSDKADKATSIGVGGLATGGGNLSANRTITVPKATEAQAQARTQDDVALTPLTGNKLVAARDDLVMIVTDQKAANVGAGNSAAGIQIRTLNTVVKAGIPGASLLANKITLPAGRYHIKFRAPAYLADRNAAWLRIAGAPGGLVASALVIGSAAYNSNTSQSQTWSEGDDFVTLTGATELELVHQMTNTPVTGGLGISANVGLPETYSKVWIKKVD